MQSSDYEIEYGQTSDGTVTLQGFPESVWYLNGHYVRQFLYHRHNWVYMSARGLILYTTEDGHYGIANNDQGWQDVFNGVADRYFVKTSVLNSLRHWSGPAPELDIAAPLEPSGEVCRFVAGQPTNESKVSPEEARRAVAVVVGLFAEAKRLKPLHLKFFFYEAVHKWFPVWAASQGQRFQIRIANDSDAKVAFEIIGEGSYLPKCKKLLHSEKLALQPDDYVLDLGANVGLFMIWAFVVVGVKRMYCVEPGQQSIEVLMKNAAWAASAGCECTVHAVAIAAETGEAAFNDHTETIGGASRARLQRLEKYMKPSILNAVVTYNVPCATLDQLLSDEITAIKMDIEGADLELLSQRREWKNVRRLHMELSVDQLRRESPDGGGFETFVAICEALRAGGFQLGLTDTTEIFNPAYFRIDHFRKGYDNNLWFWRPVPRESSVENPPEELTYFHNPRDAFALIQAKRLLKKAPA